MIYYQDEWVKQYCGDALKILPEIESDSIDLLCTDPPYGISFMGKDWDKALPDKQIWAECFRVLKAGSFAFVMSIPRADCLSRIIISLEDAGFWVNFTPIFWCFASGFPKAQNIGKAVDKRLGAEREVVGKGSRHNSGQFGGDIYGQYEGGIPDKTKATSPQAKALDGSYGGFQPKPAVEVIIICMKPLSEKTFVDQALKNRKGITWLDDCRIPYESDADKGNPQRFQKTDGGIFLASDPANTEVGKQGGRFPANLLVSDDVLNDGRRQRGGICRGNASSIYGSKSDNTKVWYGEEFGSFSRYFDLDKWAQKTFPFLIVPKASKSEKNRGLDNTPIVPCSALGINNDPRFRNVQGRSGDNKTHNAHPTVKPLKLMSYLITLGSREGDVVLDPFSGSGTTLLACQLLNRKCIGIEIEEKYCEIAAKRCSQGVFDLR